LKLIGLNNMKKTYNKFLIILTFAIFIGGLCLYFSKGTDSKSLVPVAFGSSLESSADGDTSSTDPVATSAPSSDTTSDISFLATLVSLKNLKIDTSIFSNASFNNLQNNSVAIEAVKAGRSNPFAPIDSINNNTSVATVITNQPTQITSNSVILNGTINTMNGSADTYFEYGTSTQGAGNSTISVKQSLVGTFIKNVSGLTPKTTYFFKACAKISGVVSCGEVISFTTK